MNTVTLSPIPPHLLWEANRTCNACELRAACNGAVPGEGYPHVDIMAVGEAPGVREDIGGRPFVGMAGEELDNYLWQIGLRREDVFIDNICHCRPSGRNAKVDWEPKPEHIEVCTSLWLEPTIAMVKPKVIISLGATATKYLFGEEVNVGDVNAIPRVIKREFGEIVVVPMYHPAAALRNTGLMRRVQEGFQVVRQVLDGQWVPVKDEYEGRAVYGTEKALLDQVISDAHKVGRVALDTEYLIVDGTLLCISLSAKPGTGVVIMAGDVEGMGRVKELVETVGITTIMHNCLSDDTRVMLAEPHPELQTYKARHMTACVKEIVEKQVNALVWTWNEKTKITEAKRIFQWHKHSAKGKTWWKIKTEASYQAPTVTSDHRYLVNHNEMVEFSRAEDVVVGDKVFLTRPTPNPLQLQYVVGSLLGDGSLYASYGKAGEGLAIQQANESYTLAKHAVLKSLPSSSKISVAPNNRGFSKPDGVLYKFQVYATDWLRPFRSEGKKSLTECLNRLNWAGLAIWYGDDGSLQGGKTVVIHTEGCPREVVLHAVHLLYRRFGINARLRYRNVRGEMRPFICIPRESWDIFFKGIAPWLPEAVSYKLPSQYKGISKAALDTEALQKGRWVTVTESGPSERKVNLEKCYSIGVEDNHNFFITNGLVSNSLADLDKLWNNNIYPTAIADTLYELYWQGIRPLGLKIQSKRLLGVEMEEYEDVVRDAQKGVSVEYLEQIAVREWPNAEPDVKIIPKKEKWKALKFTKKNKDPIAMNPDHPLHNVKMKVKVQDEGGMEIKVHQPQNIQKKAKKIIADTVGKGAEPYERWGRIPEREREMVEVEFGVMPIAGLDKVPEEEWIPYAARDADCTFRLMEKLQ